MTLVVENITLPQDEVDFDELVERELRDQATLDEKQYLLDHKHQWRQALLILKKKSEVQFTACRARRFSAIQRYQTARYDERYSVTQLDQIHKETLESLRKEQDWKHKANFFLFNIESRLYALNND